MDGKGRWIDNVFFEIPSNQPGSSLWSSELY
jgi:hypothetical protein